jgi:hypothetical protein
VQADAPFVSEFYAALTSQQKECSPHACQVAKYIAEQFCGKRFFQLSSEEIMGLIYRLSTLSLELCPG